MLGLSKLHLSRKNQSSKVTTFDISLLGASDVITSKICTRCSPNKPLPIARFRKSRINKCGYESWCIECTRARGNEAYRAHRASLGKTVTPRVLKAPATNEYRVTFAEKHNPDSVYIIPPAFLQPIQNIAKHKNLSIQKVVGKLLGASLLNYKNLQKKLALIEARKNEITSETDPLENIDFQYADKIYGKAIAEKRKFVKPRGRMSNQMKQYLNVDYEDVPTL